MKKIRSKSLQEWKEYCSSENVPVKTMKYIICLEERIKQLTLTDVVVSEAELCGRCNGVGQVMNDNGTKMVNCRYCT